MALELAFRTACLEQTAALCPFLHGLDHNWREVDGIDGREGAGGGQVLGQLRIPAPEVQHSGPGAQGQGVEPGPHAFIRSEPVEYGASLLVLAAVYCVDVPLVPIAQRLVQEGAAKEGKVTATPGTGAREERRHGISPPTPTNATHMIVTH